MRISYNATAMRANNALNKADKKVSSSLGKLSSGLKVNSAKDNPSGYAIARRMNAQIEGLSIANKNANTGINIIETADGALTEVHDMLQRMNELAIKGSTGTLTTTDRQTLNQELLQLKQEVSRIAETTEFNGQPILDGSFDLKGYTNNLISKVAYYSDDVIDKEYTIDALTVMYQDNGKIDLEATKATFAAGDGFPKGVEVSKVGENSVTLANQNGFEITIDVTPVPVEDADGNVITYQNVVLAGNFASDAVMTGMFQADGTFDEAATVQEYARAGYKLLEYTQAAAGQPVTIRAVDAEGNEWNFTSTPQAQTDPTGTVIGYAATETLPGAGTVEQNPSTIINIIGIGAMDTQIGANEGQSLEIRIPTISLQRLGITNAEVTTQENSRDTIDSVKGAILYVSDARSRLGAYQNRLEHTISNLDVTSENMTASYSRIMDVDMAEEMTSYTTQQVVAQAATSMLAQANERPSQVLQLLQ